MLTEQCFQVELRVVTRERSFPAGRWPTRPKTAVNASISLPASLPIFVVCIAARRYIASTSHQYNLNLCLLCHCPEPLRLVRTRRTSPLHLKTIAEVVPPH